MRFLILTQYFPPEVGAPQVRLACMIRELVRLGHEAEVVTALPNYPTGQIAREYRGRLYVRDRWEQVPVHRIWLYTSMGAGPKRMLNYASFTLTSLLGLMRAKRPDYLFVESPPLFLSVPAYVAAKRWRVPIIFNVADLWPDSVRKLGILREGLLLRFADWLERWTYRHATYVNAVTQGIRRTLLEQKHVPAARVLFMPNGVDVQLFRPREPDAELAKSLDLHDKRVILYAGTLGFAQALDGVLEAMSLLQAEAADLVLLFIGSGSEKDRLVRLAQAMKLSNVRFLDPAPPGYVARLYSFACAGLASLKDLPLLRGARPSKILPIMASARPVLYSGSGEGAQLITEADAGIAVPPENPQALAAAIRDLLSNPQRAAELGRNGRLFVERNLSWPTLVCDWLEQLRQGGDRER